MITFNLFAIFICISAFFFCIVESSRRKLPLKEDVQHIRRRHRNSTECHFGKKTYEIEERWSPDLGPPFGVMYCIRCECIAISKKRRIVARTRCRNIKNECPKPRCREPRLLPQRCCKSCPGSDQNSIEDNIALSNTEMEATSRAPEKYVALLTGYRTATKSQCLAAARAHLTFLKRNLHYTILTNGVQRVTAVRFTDHEANIVYEQLLQPSNSAKICGIWRKLPRMYRRLLQKERLTIQLMTSASPSAYLLGPITANIPIDSNLFESVLAPNVNSAGGGGMATFAVNDNTALISLTFSGLFSNTKAATQTVNVNIDKVNEKDNTRTSIWTSVANIQRPSMEHEVISDQLNVTNAQLRHMARVKYTIAVKVLNSPHEIHGQIMALQTCDVFQAVLSGQQSSRVAKPQTGAAGVALFELTQTGGIDFKVNLQALSGEVIQIPIQWVTKRDKTKKSYEILAFYMNGWANGTYSRLTSKEVSMMLATDMYVNVVTEPLHPHSEIRGKVHRVLHTEAHLYGQPLVLRGNKTSAAAVAWLYVDNHCRLHFDVSASGMSRRDGTNQQSIGNERHILELVEMPGQAGVTKEQRINLQKFDGIYVNSLESDLDELTLSRLNSGGTYLRLTSKHYSTVTGAKQKLVAVLQLKARIHNVKVPTSCLSQASRSRPSMVQYEQQSTNSVTNLAKCYYEAKAYNEGDQWQSRNHKCMMCSCQKGAVICDRVLCPHLTCSRQLSLSTQCCPVCADEQLQSNSSHHGCFFEGDQKFHIAGTTWHPYLPPHGFSKCAVCTCDARTLQVRCTRINCRPLTCPEHVAYREDPMACCKKCPDVRNNAIQVRSGHRSQARDQGSLWTIAEILNNGGCKYRGNVYKNGDFWNPIIKPFGAMKNICCHCKDGKRRCQKRNCMRSTQTSVCPDGKAPPCHHSSTRQPTTRKKHRRKS